jgi:uncharacterized membrane protein AbrB (regulator of aidB expression)
MKTANGVSPSVSATDIWISIIVFLVVFIALGIAAGWLMLRYGRRELGEDLLAGVTSPPGGGGGGSASLDAESSDEDESSLVY